MKAMVLIYKRELSHSVWQDFDHRCRSMESLEKKLRQGVRRGEWVAWRIITIHREAIGNVY